MENAIANFIIFDPLISSSSDNDSEIEIEFISGELNDEIEEDGKCYCILCRPMVPRIHNFLETVIDNLNNIQFQQHFRLNRETFDYILYLIRPDLENVDGRKRISPEKQLYIALWYLGTPDTYRSVTTKFGVSPSTALSATKRVVKALCRVRSYFIKWPSLQECNATAERIEAVSLYPGVIGAVDGTHIRIAAPKEKPEAYINRKGFHSIQFQVTCNDRLEFIHCYGGLPGSVHDARVFSYSGLQQYCNEEYFPNDYHLLGDSAYSLQKQVMVPYRDDGHLNVEQIYHNKRLSSARMMVERSIGLLKGRWRFLLDKVPMRRIDLIPYYVMAACVLHNLCLKLGDTFEFPIMIPDAIDPVEPLGVPNENKVAGNIKRNAICDVLNQI